MRNQDFKKISNGHYESTEYIIKYGEYSNSRRFFNAWRITRRVDGKWCDCQSLKFAKEFCKNPIENAWSESEAIE